MRTHKLGLNPGEDAEAMNMEAAGRSCGSQQSGTMQ